METATEASRDVLRVADVARVLGVGTSTAYDMVRGPGFPAVRIERVYRVPRGALERWLVERAAEGANVATSRGTARSRSRSRRAGV